MSRDNEESAFPSGPTGDSMTFEDGRTTHQYPAQPGMSLRDWFAGMAMQGILSSDTELFLKTEDIADIAYGQADEMIEQRNKKQDEDGGNWSAMFIGGDQHGTIFNTESVPVIECADGQYHRHFLGLEGLCFKLVYIWSELSSEKVVDLMFDSISKTPTPAREGVVTLCNTDGKTQLVVDDGVRRMTVVMDKTMLALLAEGCADCFNALDK